jgi:hypothetical protein
MHTTTLALYGGLSSLADITQQPFVSLDWHMPIEDCSAIFTGSICVIDV